jgi:integrase
VAHVERRKRGGKTTWRVRWRDPDGRERSRSFDRAAAANQYAAELEIQMATHAYVDPRAGRMSVRDYGERWRAAQVCREGTAEVQRRALVGRLYPVLGDRPIGAVRRTEIQGWVRGLEDTLAPSTIEVTFRYASAMFRAAADDRVIGSSPCVRIQLPRPDRARVVPLTDVQVGALIDHAPTFWGSVFTVMAGTGLRPGEVLGLTWDRVDWGRREVRVDRQALQPPSGPTRLGPPKSRASERTVPLPAAALEVLGARHEVAADRGGLVFPGGQGRPLRRGGMAAAFDRARYRAWLAGREEAQARGAEVPTEVIPEWATPHDLRHYYASLLIHEGEPVTVVQRRLGHDKPTETLETYAHLWPDVEERTRAAVDRHLLAGAARSRPEEADDGA